VEGTLRGSATDLNGSYRIDALQPGTYTLVATMIGYSKMRIEAVQVKPGDVQKLDFSMSMEALQGKEVVVTAKAVRNTEASLLKDRQKSKAVSDAVSAETISRSGSSNAAEAMKHVTGASVVDGKHVYVRGLGDRYTSTQLNGSELPSTNPYRRSAPMDLFPSNLVDNIVTVKSFTPDKPGNFSGGTVNIETKDFPEKFSLAFSASSSYNDHTTFDDNMLGYDGSETDWLGYDDGTRDLPDLLQQKSVEIPDLGSAFTDTDAAVKLGQYSKAFNPTIAPESMAPPLNQSYSFSIGNQFDLFKRPLGVMASVSYKNNYSGYTDGVSGRWQLTGDVAKTNTLNNDYDLTDIKGVHDVLWGGMLKVAYRLSHNHQIAFNSVYNQNGENTARYLFGSFPYDLDEESVYQTRVLQYNERTLRSFQLDGDHQLLGLNGTRLSWKASYHKAIQDEPDLRYFTSSYKDRERNGEVRRYYKIKENQPPSRYFRNMDEDHGEFKLDLSVPFSQWSGKSSTFKFGGMVAQKQRDFSERLFTFKQNPTYNYNGNPNDLFSEDNVGLLDSSGVINQFGLYTVEIYQPSSNYTGDRTISAGYAMVDMPLMERLRFIGGVRYETTDMEVASQDTTKEKGILNTDDLLPSVNLIYELTGNTNLRLAYGRTLARPSFREMAPYASFDFWGGFIFLGNENLNRTLIDNVDLRWEWFPRPGEIFAVSAFSKVFHDPIERVIENINQEIRFRNVDQAQVIGLEFEMRKRLDMISPSLKNFLVGGNLSLVHSRVDIAANELAMIRDVDPDADDSREFQGQSPYILNLNLDYDNPKLGLSSSLYYNVFGERLAEVSLGGTPDVYEQPLHMLNFFISKSLIDNVKIKVSVDNILDSKNEKIHEYKGEEYIFSQYSIGRTFSLGLSYDL
jgi:TonB-dependent receptor